MTHTLSSPLKPLAVLLLLATSWLSAFGQATARLEADTIALGDQTTLQIRNAFTFPSVDMLTQNGVIALEQTFDTAARTQTTVVTSFEPGIHAIRLSDDDSLLLTVVAPEVDTVKAELRDITPVEDVPYTFWEIFRWVLLALLVIALGWLAYWLYQHRKQLRPAAMFEPTPVVDKRTPLERANDGLEELRQRGLWQAGRVKEYYTELTDIVRRYVEEATQINATDLTTDQILDALRPKGADIAPLQRLLGLADMVKFAKSQPLPHEHDQAMADARTYIAGLWQVLHPEPAAPNAAENKGKEENLA